MIVRQRRSLKKYTQNLKPGTKTKFGATDQFFMYLSWLRNSFTITMISWLFHTRKSSISICHMDSLTIFFPLRVLLYGQVKIRHYKQCLKHSKLYTLLLDALMTATKHFVKSPHHCPPKAVSIECISNFPDEKDCLE